MLPTGMQNMRRCGAS